MGRESVNVTEFLLAGKDPERRALLLPREECTYGELRRRSDQIAHWISRMGGRKGDRAILIGENSLFWVAAYLGVMRAGLVCVPLPGSVPEQDLGHVLAITEARFVFAQSTIAARNSGRWGELHMVTDRDDPWSDAPGGGISLPATERDGLAALMFTSGSTGQPRGVMVSHGNIIANTESIIEYLGLTERDRMMTVLPFHYCFGTSLLHTHLRAGASMVLDSRFLYPETVLQRMLETECTGFAGVPSHFQMLLRNSSLAQKKFPHLRHVQQAGGYLAPPFVRDLREALPDTRIFIMYGQTEATARLSYLPPELLDTKPGSIGKGMPGVKLRVVNESGEDARRGEVGEIVAEGENVAHGYWRAPEESAKSFRDGTLYTGDLATVDEDGYLYIVDRAKDFLKCGGKRVSCRQIEEQLLAFEGLTEAAVIGIPDDVLGEAVKAFVVPRSGDGNRLAERLAGFCKGRLQPQLVPKEIVVLPSLPKNSAGKVVKSRLKTL